MASIRKRAVNRWEAQVRVKGHSSVTKTFRSKAEAKSWASHQENGIRNASRRLSEPSRTPLLGDCLDRYSREVSALKRGYLQEISRIKFLRKSGLASKPIGILSGTDMAQYREARLRQVGPATTTRELALLSHVFTVARQEWGLEFLGNPVMGIRKPKLGPGRSRRVTGQEIDQLVSVTDSHDLKAIIVLAVETAMRRSELANLSWRQVNLKTRLITLYVTKNDRIRHIPLSTKATELLALLKPSASAEGNVFAIRADSITQAFIRACNRAEIQGLRFHDLRHEATSRLFEKGLNVMEAASITGHSDLKMLSRYTHLNPSTLLDRLG